MSKKTEMFYDTSEVCEESEGEKQEVFETIVTVDEKGRCSFELPEKKQHHTGEHDDNTKTDKKNLQSLSSGMVVAASTSSVETSVENRGSRKRTADVEELSGTEVGRKKAKLEREVCEVVITVGDKGRCSFDVLDETSIHIIDEDSSAASLDIDTADTTQSPGLGDEAKKARHESEIVEAVITVTEKGRCSFEVLDDSSNHEDLIDNLTVVVSKDREKQENITSVELNETVVDLTEAGYSSGAEAVALDLTEAGYSSGAEAVALDTSSSTSDTVEQEVVGISEEDTSEVKIPDVSEYVSLDCEFVGVRKITEEGVKNDISALGRCSIVDFSGNILCDIYALPNEPIVHLRTKWSGIKRHHMQPGFAIPAKAALTQISNVIKDKVVVGHALKNDFDVLEIEHPVELRRDTSLYRPFIEQFATGSSVSLKTLASNILGKNIQKGSHCSVIDAQTTMEVFKSVREEWELSIASGRSPVFEQGNPKKKKKPRKKNTVISNVCNGNMSNTGCEENSGRSRNPGIENGHHDCHQSDQNHSEYLGYSGGRVRYENYSQSSYQNRYYGYGESHYSHAYRTHDYRTGYRGGSDRQSNGGSGQFYLDSYFEDEYWPDAAEYY